MRKKPFLESTEKVRRPTRVETSSTTVPVAAQADDTGVEIGVLHAVPEVGSVQVELSVCALSPGHDAAGCVLQLDGDSALTFHKGLDPDVSLTVLEGGGDLDAGVAEVAQSDVVLADHHQADVAVDTAVECKVGLLGVDTVVDAVVHLDGELVVFCQQVGDMDTEGGVAAVVGADVPAVQQNFGAGIDALELQPDFLRSCVERRSGKGGAVGAGAAPVIVAAVLAVFCVPRVGRSTRVVLPSGPVNCQSCMSLAMLRIRFPPVYL